MTDCDKSLFERGLFTDFTIRCQGHEWNVHKAIVCGRSGYFRRLCTSEFQVRENIHTIPTYDLNLTSRKLEMA
jgi:BTB/POZ domain